MKEAKFTPGPWAINIFDNCSIHGEDKIAICDLRHKDGEPRQNANANAALIAAAPEMFEALKAVIDYNKGNGKFNLSTLKGQERADRAFDLWELEVKPKIEQALAKARGEVNQPKGANEQP